MGEAKGVKVPSGEYDTFFTESDDLDANGMKVKFKTYFAKGVGMVKQEITIGSQVVVIELEKYEEGKKSLTNQSRRPSRKEILLLKRSGGL